MDSTSRQVFVSTSKWYEDDDFSGIVLPEDWEDIVDAEFDGLALYYEMKRQAPYWAEMDFWDAIQESFTDRAKRRVDVLKVWSIKTPPRARGPKRVRG